MAILAKSTPAEPLKNDPSQLNFAAVTPLKNPSTSPGPRRPYIADAFFVFSEKFFLAGRKTAYFACLRRRLST